MPYRNRRLPLWLRLLLAVALDVAATLLLRRRGKP